MDTKSKLATAIAVAAIIATAGIAFALSPTATFAQSTANASSNGTGKDFSENLIGQGEENLSGNATTAGTLTDSGFGTNDTSIAANQGQGGGEKIVQQGTVTSAPDPLPGHESHDLAMILPPRDDGSIYTGTLTFTASKQVEVVVLHMQDLQGEEIGDEFGTILTAPLGDDTVAISVITPNYGDSPVAATSIQFTGSALALHTLSGEPFAATYTVSAEVDDAETVNSLGETETTAANATSTMTGNATGITSSNTTSMLNDTADEITEESRLFGEEGQ